MTESYLNLDHTGVGKSFGAYTQVGPEFTATCEGVKKRKRFAVFECGCGLRLVRDISGVKHSTPLGCNSCSVLRKNQTHGMKNTPEWKAWKSMKDRCKSNQPHVRKTYKDRGITVCAEWLGDQGFQNFLDHIGLMPVAGMQVDRINTNGHYEPGNVRWTTPKQNNRNRRDNRKHTLHGVTRCLKEWAEVSGLKYTTLLWRIDSGKSLEEAITVPVRQFKN